MAVSVLLEGDHGLALAAVLVEHEGVRAAQAHTRLPVRGQQLGPEEAQSVYSTDHEGGQINLLSCQSFEQIIVGGVPDDDGPGAGVLLQELLDGHRAVPDINVTRTRPRHHLTGVCPPTSCT